MGSVYDSGGRRVGEVNAWRGVYDATGRKAGQVNIWSDKVIDASRHLVGTADSSGNVRGVMGYQLCKVPFLGLEVFDVFGNHLGSVGLAGAPEPAPDMQWRGAAALLLLCGGLEDIVVDAHQKRQEAIWEERRLVRERRRELFQKAMVVGGRLIKKAAERLKEKRSP